MSFCPTKLTLTKGLNMKKVALIALILATSSAGLLAQATTMPDLSGISGHVETLKEIGAGIAVLILGFSVAKVGAAWIRKARG